MLKEHYFVVLEKFHYYLREELEEEVHCLMSMLHFIMKVFQLRLRALSLNLHLS